MAIGHKRWKPTPQSVSELANFSINGNEHQDYQAVAGLRLPSVREGVDFLWHIKARRT